MKASRTSAVLLTGICALVGISNVALAAGHEATPRMETKKLQPATRYSGRTPVDLNNGIVFNYGTYGMQNPTYEKWAEAPVLVPGVSDLPYPYTSKEQFVRGLEENVRFVEDAITNWKTVSSITKPEAKEYGEKSAAAMEPLLSRFKDTVRAVSSSSANDWEKNQSDARRALVEMRATYASLHKNVK